MPVTSWKGAPKDPQDVRDYGINWAADLPAGVTITGSTWVRKSGDVVIGDDSHTTTGTVVRLSGGTVAASPSVLTNHIVMSDGQELDIDNPLPIKERVSK